LKFRETQEKQTPNREQLIPSNLTINLAFINDFAASGAIGNALIESRQRRDTPQRLA